MPRASWAQRSTSAIRYTRLALRWAVAVPCLTGAVLLLTVPAAATEWRSLGLPEWGRWALGLAETTAAGLWLWPATALVGAISLVLVLATTVALHVALQEPLGLLPVYAAGVLTWLLTTRLEK